MSDGYTKLFGSILDSTIWQEPAATRLVWITLLAMADRDGIVQASVPGLAKRAGVALEDTVAALATLTAPDPWSRSSEADGRRIEAVDGGWELINHAKYRHMRSEEHERSRDAEKKRRKRARSVSPSVPVCPPPSPAVPTNPPIAEAEADTDPQQTERSSGSESTHDIAFSALVRGYAARYERAANDLWQSAGKSRADITTVAAYVVASARATGKAWQAIVDEVLDGVFADAWMAERRWPWAQIAKDPARYRGGNVKALPSAPRLSPARARLATAVAAEERARFDDDATAEQRAAAVAEMQAAQAAVRREAAAR